MTDDDQFGQRLGTLLHAELSDVHSAPGLSDRLRGRARRNRLVAGTGAVALLTIAVAVGLVVAPASDGVRTGPELVDVAHVRTQVTDALARSTDHVVLARSTDSVNRVDEWTDATTGRTRHDVYADGKNLSWSTVVTKEPDGGTRWLQVDYLNRWWSEQQTTAADREPQPAQLGARDPYQGRLPSPSPEDIGKALVDGTFEIVGTATIDGHDTLHLRLETTTPLYQPLGATTAEPGRGSVPTTMEIWVDADSYLPYRSTVSRTTKFGEQTRSTTYTWSERTPENLKVLDLTAPAGFADRTGGKIR